LKVGLIFDQGCIFGKQERKSMDLVLRQAIQTDVPQIISISAKVWDGEDYIGAVIDEWLADPRGGVIVAVSGRTVVGFGRWVQLWPGYLWLEGLRVDPAWRGAGIARTLTHHLLEVCRLQSADRVALCTYLGNDAIIHLAGSCGFRRAASFTYAEAGPTSLARAQARFSPEVKPLDTGTALDFIGNSAFMRASGGFFPHGWRFLPFTIAPEAVFARMRWILGVLRGSQVIGVLCAGHLLRHRQEFTIDFVDGEPEAVEVLLRHALALAQSARSVEMMLPYAGTQPVVALPLITQLGFEMWQSGEPDVFVYEKTPL